MCATVVSLLPKFTSLVSLNMLQNLLKSNYGQYLDVWGRQEKFPNGLKLLNPQLQHAHICFKQFLSCLPHTLEELLMNQNDIELVENCDLGLLYQIYEDGNSIIPVKCHQSSDDNILQDRIHPRINVNLFAATRY